MIMNPLSICSREHVADLLVVGHFRKRIQDARVPDIIPYDQDHQDVLEQLRLCQGSHK